MPWSAYRRRLRSGGPGGPKSSPVDDSRRSIPRVLKTTSWFHRRLHIRRQVRSTSVLPSSFQRREERAVSGGPSTAEASPSTDHTPNLAAERARDTGLTHDSVSERVSGSQHRALPHGVALHRRGSVGPDVRSDHRRRGRATFPSSGTPRHGG